MPSEYVYEEWDSSEDSYHIDLSKRTSVLREDYKNYLKEYGNPISQNFVSILDETFSEFILPKQSEFRKEDAYLYTSKRHPIKRILDQQVNPPDNWKDHFYEECLFNICWDFEKSPLVFVKSDVGCGKSTFVDFFLRCYCPSNRERKQLYLDNKLIINIDTRSVQNVSEFNDIFFHKMREKIERICLKNKYEIEIENNCAMWDPKFHWDKKIHQIKLGNESIENYRIQMVRKIVATVSDEEWVELALKYITKCIETNDNSNPFSAIVLCIDNIDQSTFKVQSRALTIVRNWMSPDSGINIDCYLIPLWPNTMDIIISEIEPLPAYTEVELGKLKTDDLLEKRSNKLIEGIEANKREIRWHDIYDFDIEAGELVTSRDQCEEYIKIILKESSGRFTQFLDFVSGGSARRQLDLWKTTLSSRVLYRHYHEYSHFKANKDENLDKITLSSYYLFDGLLTGQSIVFDESRNNIINIFNMGRNIKSPEDVLIGLHIFTLMYEHGFTSRVNIENVLEPLGYRKETINNVMEYFRKKHVFQWKSSEIRDFFVCYPNVLKAYNFLLKERVYIDNMALVTPIFDERNDNIKLTHSYRIDDIIDRCLTSLEFIHELYRIERAFCMSESRLQKLNKDKFSKALRDIEFPYYSKIIARAYLSDLRTIKRLVGKRINQLKKSWEQIKNHKVFSVTESVSRFLTPID